MARKPLLERVAEARTPHELSWPVGPADYRPLSELGHRDFRFSEEDYGDYLATSNLIYSAAALRARLMSSVALRFYRGRGTQREERDDSPAARLYERVNPFWSNARLERMDELAMCVWGESAWAIERTPRTREPREIWWIKPTNLLPVIHAERYIDGYVYEPVSGGSGMLRFAADEVVWFRYPNPVDEFSPLSPLAAARLAADTAQDMTRSNRDLFSNGLQIGGLVVPDTNKVSFSRTQAEELEALLSRRWTQKDQKHKWAVLRYEAQLKNLNVTPKDAEYAEGLKLTLRDVANAYGIPMVLLNSLEHATLSNTREFERQLWVQALQPDSRLRAAEIREQFLPMFRGGPDTCEYDYSTVTALQESEGERWARERQAIEVGRYTINEVRKRAGEPPVPWGDVWWAPVNKSAVSDASSQPQGDTTPPGDEDGDQDGDNGGQQAVPVRPVGPPADRRHALLDDLDGFREALPALTNGHSGGQ
ncbi:MAG: phage portal protein [bacterium]